MERIDFLTSVGKVMLLHKTHYDENKFNILKEEIIKINSTHPFIAIMDDALIPKVITATIPMVTQAKIINKTTTQLALNIDGGVIFAPPGKKSVTKFSEVEEWIKKCNLKPTDTVLVYPNIAGIEYKLMITGLDVKAYAKNQYGTVIDITPAYKRCGQNDLRLGDGIYYGILSPTRTFWDSFESNKKDGTGVCVYKTPLKAMYNALIHPDVETNFDILNEIEEHISRSNIGVLNHDNIEDMLQEIHTLSDGVVSYELKTVAELTEQLIAEVYADYVQYYFIDGITIEINDLDKQKNVKAYANSPILNANLYRPVENIISVKTNTINFELSRFSEVIPVLYFDTKYYFNQAIHNIILDNCSIYNQYKLAKGAEFEICVTENSYGILKTEISDVTKESVGFNEITHCVKCGAELTLKNDHLYCFNEDCEAASIKKLSSFFQLFGIMKFTQSIAKEFYLKGYTTPFLLANIKYNDLIIIGRALTQVEITKMYSTCQSLARMTTDLNKLQTASSCFNGISTTLLKMFDIRTLEDAGKCNTDGVSKEDIIDMTKNWLIWHTKNPFKIA